MLRPILDVETPLMPDLAARARDEPALLADPVLLDTPEANFDPTEEPALLAEDATAFMPFTAFLPTALPALLAALMPARMPAANLVLA